MSYSGVDLVNHYRRKTNHLSLLKRRRSIFVWTYVLLSWVIILTIFMANEFIPSLCGGGVIYGLLTYVFIKAYIEISKDIREVNSILNVPNPFL